MRGAEHPSAACLRGARTSLIERRQLRRVMRARPATGGDTGYRSGPRKARYSRTPNLDIAKVVQNRNGSALAQLGSVTQQRR